MSSITDILGTPVDFTKEWEFRYSRNYWTWDYYPDRPLTIITQVQLNLARLQSKFFAETTPNGAGILRGIKNYLCGSGSKLAWCTDDEVDPPEQLSKRLNKFLNKWRRVSQFQAVEREMAHRLHRDGEFFIRLWPQDNGITEMTFIEPISIQPPKGEDHIGPWSWGVYTPDRVDKPQAYNFFNWQQSTDEMIPAQFIVHGKINCTINQKRGLPSFYACGDELAGAGRLRGILRESEMVRQAIAYIVEHDKGVTQDVVQTLLANEPGVDTVSRPTANSTYSVQYTKREPGMVPHIPADTKVHDPPGTVYQGEAAGIGVTQALQAVANRFQCPDWMAGCGTDSSSFASALVSESPFIKQTEADQTELAGFENILFTRLVEIGTEQDLLPTYILDEIYPDVTFPSPVVRNQKDESDRRIALVTAKIMSRHTAASEEGLDFEVEQNHLTSEEHLDPAEDQSGERGAPKTTGGERQKLQGATY